MTSGAARSASSNNTTPEVELAQFFDIALDLLCIITTDGEFRHVNQTFQTVLGYEENELKNSRFLELVHPEDQGATESTLQELLTGRPVIDMENRLRAQNGDYRWLQWRSKLNEGGDLIYAAGRDITHRRRLERQLLDIHDRTRREVGSDLHDELGQRLTGIHMIVTQLARQVEEGSPVTAEQLQKVAREIQQTDEIAEALTEKLVPVPIEENGLRVALDRLAARSERLFNIECTTDIASSMTMPDPTIATHLYHIAQEAITNCVKHGQATRVTVSLTRHNHHLRLQVTDNGTGSPEELRRFSSDGRGLSIMEYRASRIGGSLEITSNPDGPGITLTCDIPAAD